MYLSVREVAVMGVIGRCAGERDDDVPLCGDCAPFGRRHVVRVGAVITRGSRRKLFLERKQGCSPRQRAEFSTNSLRKTRLITKGGQQWLLKNTVSILAHAKAETARTPDGNT